MPWFDKYTAHFLWHHLANCLQSHIVILFSLVWNHRNELELNQLFTMALFILLEQIQCKSMCSKDPQKCGNVHIRCIKRFHRVWRYPGALLHPSLKSGKCMTPPRVCQNLLKWAGNSHSNRTLTPIIRPKLPWCGLLGTWWMFCSGLVQART